MTARSVSRRAWRLLGSSGVLFLAVLLLAISALSGNVFQNTSRGDLKHDLGESRKETAASRRETAAVKHQLDLVKGEQECRAQIASEAELIAGQLQAAIGKLLIAAQEQNEMDRVSALAEIASSTVALVPALKARQDSVVTCSGAEAAAPGAPVTTSTTSTVTTSTTKPAARRVPRRVSQAPRPTSTTGTTSTTVPRRPPSPSASEPCLPLLELPLDALCP